MKNTWIPFEAGKTLGQAGSEGGRILLDEEVRYAARITLEEATDHAPYAITLGIYYLLFHTHFCATLAEARSDYDRFKAQMEAILDLDGEDDVRCNQKIEELMNLR